MKRKGDLLSTVLGVVLMALGLTVFIIGVSRLYMANVDQESENAKRTLDVILGKMEALSENQSTMATLQGFSGAKNWFLQGWGVSSSSRPQKCYFSSCVCLCPGEGSTVCQKEGFCRSVSLPVIVQGDTLITFDYDAQGNRIDEQRSIRSAFSLQENLFEVNVSKSESSILLQSPLARIITMPSSGTIGPRPGGPSTQGDI